MVARSYSLAILAYPGCLQSAVLGLQDVLGYAASISEHSVAVETISTFVPGGRSFDALILPPSASEVRAADVPELPRYTAYQHGKGAVVCSACTGVTFIAEAGIAAGRPVTTHWGLEQRLSKRYPDMSFNTDQLLIEYSDLITAGGLMAWVDLGLVVIERFLGYGVAARTAGYFIVDMRRRDQRRFRRFSPHLRHGDAAILKSQHLIDARYADVLSVKEIASASGLPDRTFLRRFKAATGMTPNGYLQELRIERARGLLIETGRTVSDICFAVGYQDPPSFSRLFTKLTGLTPNAFRKHFARHDGQQKTPPIGGVL